VRLTLVLALAALIAVAYGGSLRNQLVFDDLIFMQRDARVQSLAHIDRIFSQALWSFDQSDEAQVHQYYRPLQLLPLALSHALFDTAAWPSHLLSLMLHLGNCLLAFGLYRALLGRQATAAAMVLLFAVQPAYSEAVLWASDVAGLGAALCTLAIVRLHGAARRPRLALWLNPLLLLCGLWCKESGVLAIPLVAAYDLIGAPDRGWRRVARLCWRYAAFVPALALYGALRMHALGGMLPGIGSVALSPSEMVLNAPALLPQYVRSFLWPFDPNMYHDFNAVHSLAAPRFVVGACIAAAAIALIAVTAQRHAPAAFGLLWAAIAVAPHLLVRWPQLNVFAERYLYLASVGLFLAIGYGWECVRAHLTLPGRRGVALAVVSLLAVFVAVDVRRTRDWHDEVTIYRKTLSQTQRAELIRTNLAVRLLELRDYDAGIAEIEALQRINPDWPDTWHNLGLLYLGKGDAVRATDAFERALARNPRKPATLLNLGYLYDRAGRREEAVQMYLRMVERAPRAADGWYNLGAIALELGQYGNAGYAARQVLAIKPDDAGAQILLQRATAGAAQPAPPHVPHAATIERCKRARADADAGRIEVAIIALKAAAWLDEDAPLPHHYLANVYFLRGNITAAARHEREAVRLAPDRELYSSNLRSLEAALKNSHGDTEKRSSSTGGSPP
jgi:tetratricopeptide (TPR) repeat protein